MSLLKVPCALAVALACHISWTAPAEPQSEEKLPVKDARERWLMFGVSILALLKGTYWFLGLAEVAAILFNNISAIPNYEQISANLPAWIGNPGNITLTYTSAMGLLLIVLGTWVRQRCYRELGLHFTFELSLRHKHKLVKTGPYKYLRHPGYTSITVWYVGLILWHTSPGSWVRESGILDTVPGKIYLGFFASYIAGVYVAVLGRVKKEDALLKRAFGEEWEEWSKRVPYAVIPGVW